MKKLFAKLSQLRSEPKTGRIPFEEYEDGQLIYFDGAGSYPEGHYTFKSSTQPNEFNLLDPYTLQRVSLLLLGHKSIRPCTVEEIAEIGKIPVTEKYFLHNEIVLRTDKQSTIYRITEHNAAKRQIDLTNIITGEKYKDSNEIQCAIELRKATKDEIGKASQLKLKLEKKEKRGAQTTVSAADMLPVMKVIEEPEDDVISFTELRAVQANIRNLVGRLKRFDSFERAKNAIKKPALIETLPLKEQRRARLLIEFDAENDKARRITRKLEENIEEVGVAFYEAITDETTEEAAEQHQKGKQTPAENAEPPPQPKL